MPPQIHIFDLLAIVGLTWLVLRYGWAWLRRRTPDKPMPGRWVKVAVATVVLFVMAHMWAWVRPMPVEVEVPRFLTASERELWKAKGPEMWQFILSAGRGFRSGDLVPFGYESQPTVSRTDLAKIRFYLAWGSFLPSFPKRLIIDSELPAASGVYNWRGLTQRRVNFSKRDSGWTFGTRNLRGCGDPVTNFWDKVKISSPIDFTSYD